MQTLKVLYVGDSEVVLNRYLVGADVIEQSYFNDNGRYFRDAMASQPSVEVRHITPHGVATQFPAQLSELQNYDLVIFSDVGYNSLIFYPGLTPPYQYPLGPDRIGMVRSFVEKGGGFLMVGGYLSFAGLNGIARWAGTDIETILPVSISHYDDRAEVVQGFRFNIDRPDHPIVAGLPWTGADWTLCGYNKVSLKSNATCSKLPRRSVDCLLGIRSRTKRGLYVGLCPALGRQFCSLAALRSLLESTPPLAGQAEINSFASEHQGSR